MSRIKTISYEESHGKLREIYDKIIESRGKLADVHKIQSLRPESIIKHMDLYMDVMFCRSELTRANREMIAVIVSKSNKCKYCQVHHAEALNFFWKNTERVNLLKENYHKAELNNLEIALCKYAETLSINPGICEDINLTDNLRKNGLSDLGILDATLVVAYFNFVNRIVLSLRVKTEDNPGGYKY